MNYNELDLALSYDFISNRPTLVDVGAHHGTGSLPFAQKGWRVIAFEPERENFSAFKRNLEGYEKVICIHKAVSDTSGDKVPFYVSEEHYGIHALKPFHETHKLVYEVETVRLDDALAELEVPEVTLLKVDTEGADFLALKGFDFGKYRPDLVIVEFMDSRSAENFGYTHHDVVAFMNERGYTAFVSEWAPIKEYAREGVASEPHTWIQCVPYPLDNEPAWGNLIFVPDKDKDRFSASLKRYLNHLQIEYAINQVKEMVKQIPGSRALYDLIRKIIR